MTVTVPVLKLGSAARGSEMTPAALLHPENVVALRAPSWRRCIVIGGIRANTLYYPGRLTLNSNAN